MSQNNVIPFPVPVAELRPGLRPHGPHLWEHEVICPEFAAISGEACKAWVILVALSDYSQQTTTVGLRRLGKLAGLDYRNARPKYLEAFVDSLINWDYVAELHEAAS